MKESVIYQDLIREGREQGIQQGRQEIAIHLLECGMSVEQVADLSKLSVEQVQALRDNLENATESE
ncbi:hypothetical protein [Spirulina subsalsa]|uniref:hypothetical protein n=1 Tax=Spirulina subsalsa TaxID=54311 RepID=UPI000316F2AC|nr:hypothetical protein [Spirulina subsalsa]